MTQESNGSDEIKCDECNGKMKLEIVDSDNDEMTIGSYLHCRNCGRSVSC